MILGLLQENERLEASVAEAVEIIRFYTGELPDHDAEVLGYPDGHAPTPNSQMWKRASQFLNQCGE